MRHELHGIDRQCDVVFDEHEALVAKKSALLAQLVEWQGEFSPGLPQSMAHWSRIDLTHEPVRVVLSLMEQMFAELSRTQDATGLKAQALRLLGRRNGDLPSANAKFHGEVAPQLRVVAEAIELHQPEVDAAEREAGRKLAERYQPEYDKVARRLALALSAAAGALIEERRFWPSIPLAARPYVAGHSFPELGDPARRGAIYRFFEYAVKRGILKASELPKDCQEVLLREQREQSEREEKRTAESARLVLLRFLRPCIVPPAYGRGEIASFEVSLAKRLVDRGVAEFVRESKGDSAGRGKKK